MDDKTWAKMELCFSAAEYAIERRLKSQPDLTGMPIFTASSLESQYEYVVKKDGKEIIYTEDKILELAKKMGC